MTKSPGTASQAIVNEISSWSEDELDRRVAQALCVHTHTTFPGPGLTVQCTDCGKRFS